MTKEIYEETKYYTQKIQCPKCKSFNCQLVEEVVHFHYTLTNKRTGWLRKKDIDVGGGGIITHHFECNDCGYGYPTPDENNDDFIVEEKEIYYD